MQERWRERKERKRRTKRCTKKKANKRAKYAALIDHGGKARPRSSSRSETTDYRDSSNDCSSESSLSDESSNYGWGS